MSHSEGKLSADSVFWAEFEDCLIKFGVNSKSIRWYVRWCRRFDNFLGKMSLAECQPQHVKAFLENLQDNPGVDDWQFRQARSALWHLFRDYLKISWAVKDYSGRSGKQTGLSMRFISKNQFLPDSHQQLLA